VDRKAARRSGAPAAKEPEARTPEHEWLAAVLFLAIPLVAVIGALLVTHMFTERYTLLALVGFCLLVPMVAAEYFGRRGAAAIVMLAVTLGGMVVRSVDYPVADNPLESEPLLRDALTQGPVVIGDGLLYLQMWQYAPEALKSRLIYLTDNAAAVRYAGFDSIDESLRSLRPWAALNVMEYRDFARGGREFMEYQNSGRPGWLLSRVVADGATVEINKTAPFRQLLRVRLRD